MLDPQDLALDYAIIRAIIWDNKDTQSSRHSFRPIYHPSHKLREVQMLDSPTLGCYLFFLMSLTHHTIQL